MPQDTFYYGKSKALLNCAFGKDGFAFVGWNTQRDGSGATYYNADPMIVNKDVTLYAQWKAFNGLLPGIFSVSETRKVQFASGNLQYQASTNTWRFATNQYDYIGSKNAKISATNTDWIDLFGYGTSGVNYAPYLTNVYEYGDGYTDYPSKYYYPRDAIYGTNNDWGVNEIQNTTYTGWWTLRADPAPSAYSSGPDDSWQYITCNYKNRITFAIVNGINGLLLLPDDWKQPVGLTTVPTAEHFYENDYSLTEWIVLASNGAVFLPAAGYRRGTYIRDAGSKILYWSSSSGGYAKQGAALVTYEDGAYGHQITQGCGGFYSKGGFPLRCDGLAVRLVRDVQ